METVAELDQAIAAARSRYHRSDPISGGYLAALLYMRFQVLDARWPETLRDIAMEAVVTGTCDATSPKDSLGVPLPEAAPDRRRTECLTEVIALLEPIAAGPPYHAGFVALLAQALHSLHMETGRVEPLRRAVQACEQVLTAGAADPEILHCLSSALVALDLFDGNPDRLLRAIRYSEQAAESESLPDARKSIYFCGLSAAERVLCARTGNPDILPLAVEAAASAAGLAGDVELLQGEAAYSLGVALLRSYEHSGELVEIENAVTCLRNASDIEPRPDYIGALANALLLMYALNSDGRTLEDADNASWRTIGLAGPNDPNRHEYLQRRALAAYVGFAAHGGDGVLDMALAFQRFAVGCLPPAHPRPAGAVGMLADIWMTKHECTESAADLGGALEATAQARRLSPPDDPDHWQHLARYARGLLLAYEATGRVRHLEQAIATTKEALDIDGLRGPARGTLLLLLGAYLTQYAGHTVDDALLAARNIYRECTQETDLLPFLRAQAGLAWAGLAIAAEKWAEAGFACLMALTAVQEMTGLEVSRDSQEGKLAEFAGLPSAAAACELHVGDPMNALMILELGRGVLLSQDMDLHGDIRALRQDAPELGERFAALLRERDEASASLHDMALSASPLRYRKNQLSDQRRRSARNIQAMIHQARQVPGHESFMQGPAPEELIAASASGPIAVINVSPHRSDALVVQPSGITVVPLPALTPEAIDRIGGSILSAADQPAEPSGHEAILTGLEWLWDHVAEPVLDVAAPTQAAGIPPRLWWCPTGLLSFLPLHAAGRHRHDQRRTVMARVVSSYTPTIRALQRARARYPPAAVRPNLLAVAVPRTPQSSAALPSADAEARDIAGIHVATTILAGAQATAAAVRAALPSYRRAHFACHGLTDTESPSCSSLLLCDEADVLTAADIARLDLSAAELAYLSVCDTARPNLAHADEALHIAGSFLVAGYPNVIGTLWPLPDMPGRRLARTFYHYLAEDSSPAHALHSAITDLRRRYPSQPGIWANLVHFGA